MILLKVNPNLKVLKKIIILNQDLVQETEKRNQKNIEVQEVIQETIKKKVKNINLTIKK